MATDDFARAQLGNIIVALPNKLQKFEEFTPGAYDFTTEAPLLKNLFAFDSVANSHYISIDNPGGGDPYAWVKLGGEGHPDRSGELFLTGSNLHDYITSLSGQLNATGQLLLTEGGGDHPEYVTHDEAIAYAIIFG